MVGDSGDVVSTYRRHPAAVKASPKPPSSSAPLQGMERFTCVGNLEELPAPMLHHGRCLTNMPYTDDDPDASRASLAHHTTKIVSYNLH